MTKVRLSAVGRAVSAAAGGVLAMLTVFGCAHAQSAAPAAPAQSRSGAGQISATSAMGSASNGQAAAAAAAAKAMEQASRQAAAPAAQAASATQAFSRAEALQKGKALNADLGALVPAGRPAADPAKLVEQYQIATDGVEPLDSPKVMVFASLSMPSASLRRLATDAARAGIPVYVRGLKYGLGPGNFQRGVDALREFSTTNVQFQVHPEMFELYDIQRVPAIVVAPTAQVGCKLDQCVPPVARVFGDVTLDYALERLEGRNDQVGGLARATLQRLR